MRQNFKLNIAYDGSRYYGWEHQPGIELTIQGKIETVLQRMLASDEIPEVICCGRTDAGVHAKAMIANVWLDTALNPTEIRDYLNHYLPDDICVNEVTIAAERFHARYNATGKTYCYTCYYGDTKPVFDRKYVYVLDKKPDIDLMREAAGLIVGEHDFAAFSSNPKMKKSTIRIVDSIDIKVKGPYITFTYHGTGFLQHMVRILTGTLLEVGFGKRKPDTIPELFDSRDRKAAGFTAPAQGLCMMKVDYN